MTEEEHLTSTASWTVEDADGIHHRAIQLSTGSITWGITVCPWWKTRGVSGQKVSVRTDLASTCVECIRREVAAIGKPKCVHCGAGRDAHDIHTHAFKAPTSGCFGGDGMFAQKKRRIPRGRGWARALVDGAVKHLQAVLKARP